MDPHRSLIEIISDTSKQKDVVFDSQLLGRNQIAECVAVFEKISDLNLNKNQFFNEYYI